MSAHEDDASRPCENCGVTFDIHEQLGCEQAVSNRSEGIRERQRHAAQSGGMSLITLVHEDVPALLSEVERLRAEVEAVREENGGLRRGIAEFTVDVHRKADERDAAIARAEKLSAALHGLLKAAKGSFDLGWKLPSMSGYQMAALDDLLQEGRK